MILASYILMQVTGFRLRKRSDIFGSIGLLTRNRREGKMGCFDCWIEDILNSSNRSVTPLRKYCQCLILWKRKVFLSSDVILLLGTVTHDKHLLLCNGRFLREERSGECLSTHKWDVGL